MPVFKNPIAHRVYNLAIKLEKIGQESTKVKTMNELEILATLQNHIELQINDLFFETKHAEQELKKIKKEKP